MRVIGCTKSSHTSQPNVDVEDVREQKLATIVAPDNGTPDEVLSYVLECAKAWVPEARIIGNARAGDIARAIEALPSSQKHSVGSECQYSNDVGMPEHRCAVRCQYEIEAETLVKAERRRCLDVVDQYYGGGRSFVMRKISDTALSTEGK